MERILITGALGQLGQEFIKFFNKNNTYVLATDIRSPLKDLSCDFEIADAMDEKRIDYLIKKNNINVVYHLVAVLSANGEKNPFMAWEINMKSFQNIINLSSYYPASFEVGTLQIFQTHIIDRLKILLPVLSGNNTMHFYRWKKNDILKINQFGMLEPALLLDYIIPDIMLVPMLAFDNNNNRLGYGGGFYDRYLNKYLKTHNNIVTIGIAFSFQKYHKLPVSNNDVKLNYILTEKGIF